MMNEIYNNMLNNKNDYELISNGVEVQATQCAYAHLYYNTKTHEFITLGFNDKNKVNYIEIAY